MTGVQTCALPISNTIFFLTHCQIVAGQRVNFSLDRSVVEQLYYLVVQILGDLSF